MKISSSQILALLILTCQFLSAKDLNLAISYSEFMNAEDENYLEMHFALDASSLDYALNDAGKWYGGVEIAVSLEKDSNITAVDKFRIKLPPSDDTASFNKTLINQIRLPLGPHKQWLNVNIQSIVDPSNTTELRKEVTPTLGGKNFSTSSIIPLNSYKKTEKQTPFSKSGYELVPYVTSGSNFFDEDFNELSFYSEIYNTNEALGDTGEYLLKYYLRDYDTREELSDYGSFSKKKASDVEPLLATFNIDGLPTGNYELVTEVLDKKGNKLGGEEMFFYRKNSPQTLTAEDIANVEANGTFAGQFQDLDSLTTYIDYLYPISGDKERQYQLSIMNERDKETMQRYIYSFWKQRFPNDPRKAWFDYKSKVEFVNEKYASRLRPGFKTDRGRVYLKYGPPSMQESRVLDPQYPPYELWQYGKIDSKYAVPQVNRLFVFADFNPGTQMYELLHSTALGETRSRRWRYEMVQRYKGILGDIDDDLDDDRDNFGNRLNQSLILQGTGADRQRYNR